MKAAELLKRAQKMGVSVFIDGADLVLRAPTQLPTDFIEELRRHKAEIRTFLEHEASPSIATCRGCAAAIPVGTTLCAVCGSARSPLIRYAVELSELAEQKTFRSSALLALDKCGYPRLALRDGLIVGPGLVSWCEILRDGDRKTLKRIIDLAGRKLEAVTQLNKVDKKRPFS